MSRSVAFAGLVLAALVAAALSKSSEADQVAQEARLGDGGYDGYRGFRDGGYDGYRGFGDGGYDRGYPRYGGSDGYGGYGDYGLRSYNGYERAGYGGPGRSYNNYWNGYDQRYGGTVTYPEDYGRDGGYGYGDYY